MSVRPSAVELLERPGALLTRGHLRDLGLERRAIDSVFRELPVIVLPGYSRPMVTAADYLALVERSTYRGDRVRPLTRTPSSIEVACRSTDTTFITPLSEIGRSPGERSV